MRLPIRFTRIEYIAMPCRLHIHPTFLPKHMQRIEWIPQQHYPCRPVSVPCPVHSLYVCVNQLNRTLAGHQRKTTEQNIKSTYRNYTYNNLFVCWFVIQGCASNTTKKKKMKKIDFKTSLLLGMKFLFVLLAVFFYLSLLVLLLSIVPLIIYYSLAERPTKNSTPKQWVSDVQRTGMNYHRERPDMYGNVYMFCVRRRNVITYTDARAGYNGSFNICVCATGWPSLLIVVGDGKRAHTLHKCAIVWLKRKWNAYNIHIR